MIEGNSIWSDTPEEELNKTIKRSMKARHLSGNCIRFICKEHNAVLQLDNERIFYPTATLDVDIDERELSGRMDAHGWLVFDMSEMYCNMNIDDDEQDEDHPGCIESWDIEISEDSE